MYINAAQLFHQLSIHRVHAGRQEKVVIPFDNQIRDETKHYNPMYFDCETSLAVGNVGADDAESVQGISMSPKLQNVSFANPLYELQIDEKGKVSNNDQQENTYEVPHVPSQQDPDYEFIEQKDTVTSTASNGIYEELPFQDDPEENHEGVKLVQKSIYDTLKSEDAEIGLVNSDYNTLETKHTV